MFKFFRSHPAALAQARIDAGEYEAAEAILGELLHAGGTQLQRANALNKRGVARVYLARREAALSDFTKALEVVERFAPALTNIGNMLFEDGDTEEAIIHYEAAVLSDPHYSRAYVNLSAAYKRLGRFDEAAREFRRAAGAARRWPRRS